MIPGVLRTRVGYAGGTTENPTYHKLGDHTECVQMDYDPTQVSFEQLLQVFWQTHNPFVQPYSKQYRSIILYQDVEQERVARAHLAILEEKRDHVFTEISPLSKFYLAEDYHQKYYLRRVDQIMAEVERRFPTLEQLVNASEVTRLNGYVGGYGSQSQLEQELSRFGLSPTAERRLRQIVAGYGR